MAFVGRVIRSIAGRGTRTMSGGSYHPPAHYKPPTMNDLPLPSGSWQEAYSKKQAKYNLALLSSIAFFAATLGVAYTGDFIFLNLPPQLKNKD